MVVDQGWRQKVTSRFLIRLSTLSVSRFTISSSRLADVRSWHIFYDYCSHFVIVHYLSAVPPPVLPQRCLIVPTSSNLPCFCGDYEFPSCTLYLSGVNQVFSILLNTSTLALLPNYLSSQSQQSLANRWASVNLRVYSPCPVWFEMGIT